MKLRHLILAFVMTITPPAFGGEPEGWADFLQAIGQVESGHDDDAVGDGGASIGRYQIQYDYWLDATQFDKTIGGRYEDVRDPAYAAKVMGAYFRRYAREAYQDGDWEVLARIHNGGPRGHKKQATLPYWRKVQQALNEN